jgi:hypothetical protein
MRFIAPAKPVGPASRWSPFFKIRSSHGTTRSLLLPPLKRCFFEIRDRRDAGPTAQFQFSRDPSRSRYLFMANRLLADEWQKFWIA